MMECWTLGPVFQISKLVYLSVDCSVGFPAKLSFPFLFFLFFLNSLITFLPCFTTVNGCETPKEGIIVISGSSFHRQNCFLPVPIHYKRGNEIHSTIITLLPETGEIKVCLRATHFFFCSWKLESNIISFKNSHSFWVSLGFVGEKINLEAQN